MATAMLSSVPIWIALLIAGFWLQSVRACLVALAITVPFALAVLAWKTRFTICPDCGRRLRVDWKEREYRQGGMLKYRCSDCKTVWRTRLYPGADI